ncbi:MAG: tyrosine-type recombinase/integrase [Acidobacteriota bacterium]
MQVAQKEKAEKLPRGIFKRGAMFWIRYADANGQLRREPGGATIRQAESKLKFRRGEKATGVVPVLRMDRLKQAKQQDANTFGAWINAAEEHHNKHSSEAHAYDFGRKCIFLRSKFGSVPIHEVNRSAILDWMEEAAEGGVTGSDEWGPANWNRYHSCLSSIFTLAIERAIADKQEPLPVNPMQWIPRRSENHKERYWSAAEDAAIISSTRKLFPGSGYEDIFILAEEVGYRKSEQLRALVGDYHAETHKIVVHQRKNKSAGPVRYVPLSDRGLAAYERLTKGKNPGEPLLTRKVKGKAQAMADVRYWFDEVLTDAKITDDAASWHVCRHTFCSRAVAAGVPITDVKEYAGHSDLRTTSRYTQAVEGVSDVNNRDALNGKGIKQQSEVAALKEQIAALTALVQKLSK